MQRLRNLCENAAVPRHPAMMRALAALLSAFLMTPGAQAAAPEASAVVAQPGADGPTADLISAPEPARRVALPGAADEPPARALVIPRQPTPDAVEPVNAPPARVIQPASTHLVALEPEAIKTVREAPPKSSHTALWIIASVLVTGAAAAGGYFLYQSSQTPTTANVNATWSH